MKLIFMFRGISLFLIFLHINSAVAQDLLYKKGGEKLRVNVLGCGLTSITYSLHNSTDTSSFIIPKNDLRRLVYANGFEEKYGQSLFSFVSTNDLEKSNRSRSIKINPLSPLFGHTQISFEYQLNRTASLEFIATLIGLGNNARTPYSIWNNKGLEAFYSERKNQSGLSLGVGYKLFLSNQQNRLQKNSVQSRGFYIRPTAYLGAFSYNSYSVISSNSLIREYNRTFFGAILLEPGVQFCVTKDFSIDFYLGIGGIIDNLDNQKSAFVDDAFGYGGPKINTEANLYSVVRFSESSPGFATTGGVKFGWTINKKSGSKKK